MKKKKRCHNVCYLNRGLQFYERNSLSRCIFLIGSLTWAHDDDTGSRADKIRSDCLPLNLTQVYIYIYIYASRLIGCNVASLFHPNTVGRLKGEAVVLMPVVSL